MFKIKQTDIVNFLWTGRLLESSIPDKRRIKHGPLRAGAFCRPSRMLGRFKLKMQRGLRATRVVARYVTWI